MILERYLNFKGISIPITEQYIEFADEDAIAGYAKTAFQTLNKLGVINGTGNDNDGRIIVDPQGSATRAQAAAMLHRFLDLIAE